MSVRTAATGLLLTALSPGGPRPTPRRRARCCRRSPCRFLAVGLSYPSVVARLTTGAGLVAVPGDPPV
ncbi:hypothetical protein [Streptomyces rochei]|uniref:hypothetical protein n=1 Tax=Streptomyces rochei TaxID=1928 RepID=UPI0036BAEA41